MGQVYIDRLTHPKVIYDPLRDRPAKVEKKPDARPAMVPQPSVMDLTDEQFGKLMEGKP